jgi:choline transport protein
MALIALYHPDLVIKTWMTFVVYQAFNLITGGIVMFGNVIIPILNKFSCMIQNSISNLAICKQLTR